MPDMSEDEYRELQRNFSKADPAMQKEIIDQIAAAFFEDMRQTARNLIGSNKQVSPTSVVVVTYLRILGFFSRGGNLERYESLDTLLHFFQRAVYCALIDKYRKECRDRGIPLEDDANDIKIEPSIPDEFVQGVMTKELAEKFMKILNEILAPEDVDLLMRRFAKGETYAQIVAQNEQTQTNDAVRMKINRIKERILNSPKMLDLKENYQG